MSRTHTIISWVVFLSILLTAIVFSASFNQYVAQFVSPWIFQRIFRPKYAFPRLHCQAPVYIVYHIGTVNNFREVVAEQMRVLKDSGLLDECRGLWVGANGPNCRDYLQNMFCVQYPKAEILVAIDTPPRTNERETLNAMCRRALTIPSNALICYIHSKGVTMTRPEPQAIWRRFMMHWIITRHQLHRSLLEKGEYRTSGVFYDYLPRFYSGNFFWARADYIRLLGGGLTGKSWLGRVEDETLCLSKYETGRHVTIIPHQKLYFFNFCHYFMTDHDSLMDEATPEIAVL